MARITKARLDRHRKLSAEKLELDRRARTLSDEIKQIEAEAEADLKASEKSSVRRGGYLLTWKEGSASVSWKGAFIKLAGAEEAARLSKEAAKPQKLQIVAPAEPQQAAA